jgi:hypothetical protein
MAARIVVIGTVVLVVLVVALLARQGSPARLSEQDGRRSRRSHVVDRPADPEAESMDVAGPDPTPAGEAPLGEGEPDGDRRNQAVSPGRAPAEGGDDEIDEELARRSWPGGSP